MRRVVGYRAKRRLSIMVGMKGDPLVGILGYEVAVEVFVVVCCS